MATPRVGRPPRLTLEEIVAAAMTMDPDTLTMQAVARWLRVAPSALYRWVTDREHLLDLVSAELGARLGPTTQPTAATWRQWLVDFAGELRAGLHEIPGFAVRLLTGPHRHQHPNPVEDAVLAAFELGGVPPELARQYWHVYSTAIIGWVVVEQNDRYPADPALDFAVLVKVLVDGTAGTAGPEEHRAP